MPRLILHDSRTGEVVARLRATHQQIEHHNARQVERVLAAAGSATASRGQRVMAVAAAARERVGRVARRVQRPAAVDAPYTARPVAEDLPGELSHEQQEEILASAVAEGKFSAGAGGALPGSDARRPVGHCAGDQHHGRRCRRSSRSQARPSTSMRLPPAGWSPHQSPAGDCRAYPAEWMPDVAQDAMVNPVELPGGEIAASAPMRNGEPQGYTSIKDNADEKAYIGQPDELVLQEGPIMFDEPGGRGANAAGVARDAQLAQQRGRRGR